MKCYCGGKIIVQVVDNEEIGDEYRDYFTGICDKCGKLYEWADVYKYTHTTPLYEINENDHL